MPQSPCNFKLYPKKNGAIASTPQNEKTKYAYP